MQLSATATFDEQERLVLSLVESPSILGGPEEDEKGPFPRTRLVRRAGHGEALNLLEAGALVEGLSASIKDRRANVVAARELGSPELASAHETWLPALSDALALACEAVARLSVAMTTEVEA